MYQDHHSIYSRQVLSVCATVVHSVSYFNTRCLAYRKIRALRQGNTDGGRICKAFSTCTFWFDFQPSLRGCYHGRHERLCREFAAKLYSTSLLHIPFDASILVRFHPHQRTGPTEYTLLVHQDVSNYECSTMLPGPWLCIGAARLASAERKG